jgi:hypothetical protein
MVDRRRVRLLLGWSAGIAVLLFIVAGIALVIIGPTSNLYPTKPLQPLNARHPGGKVFVRNADLSEELEILRSSGVFEIVSSDNATRAVELRPRQAGGVCGNPLLVTFCTFGLVPATVSNPSTFSFRLEENGSVSERQFRLEAERRVSLVQWVFKPFHSDTRTLGAILASEYERQRQ